MVPGSLSSISFLRNFPRSQSIWGPGSLLPGWPDIDEEAGLQLRPPLQLDLGGAGALWPSHSLELLFPDLWVLSKIDAQPCGPPVCWPEKHRPESPVSWRSLAFQELRSLTLSSPQSHTPRTYCLTFFPSPVSSLQVFRDPMLCSKVWPVGWWDRTWRG